MRFYVDIKRQKSTTMWRLRDQRQGRSRAQRKREKLSTLKRKEIPDCEVSMHLKIHSLTTNHNLSSWSALIKDYLTSNPKKTTRSASNQITQCHATNKKDLKIVKHSYFIPQLRGQLRHQQRLAWAKKLEITTCDSPNHALWYQTQGKALRKLS